MPGFANLDEVINAVSVNLTLQKLIWGKTTPGTTAVNIPHTLWTSTGIPGAGANPAAGLAGAVKCSGATVGAMLYTNPTGPATMHILSAGATCYQGGSGSLWLVDRLAHANISNVQATGAFNPVIDGTDRLAAGEGGMIILEVTTALTGTASTRTFTYTNEAGTSHTTPTMTTVASSLAGCVPYAQAMWMPLLAGDKGVRTITNTTYGAGGTAGNYNVVIVKPILSIPVPLVCSWTDRDCVVEMPSLPQIKDNSCLMWYWLGSVAQQSAFLGEIRIAEN